MGIGPVVGSRVSVQKSKFQETRCLEKDTSEWKPGGRWGGGFTAGRTWASRHVPHPETQYLLSRARGISGRRGVKTSGAGPSGVGALKV